MAKKVLVTGGAGFIGSHVVDRLVELGHDLVVVDNLSTGRREHLNPKASFYHLDLLDPKLEEVFEEERPQIVDHHAAQISVQTSVKEPARDAQVNIMGTLRLLDLCLKFHVEKLVFASTGGALYGEPQYLPCPEGHPIQPLAPYGLSKYVAELYLRQYQRLHDLNFTVLRYSNVYGPRQDPNGEAGVIAIFCQRMVESREVLINGSGEQERDFVYVSDVVESNILAMAPMQHRGEVYNIAWGGSHSVNQVFHTLAKVLHYNREPVHGPPKPGEVFKIHLDISKAKRELGWQPKVPIDQGLRHTADYFSQTSIRR